jgi:hypothetical protein
MPKLLKPILVLILLAASTITLRARQEDCGEFWAECVLEKTAWCHDHGYLGAKFNFKETETGCYCYWECWGLIES